MRRTERRTTSRERAARNVFVKQASLLAAQLYSACTRLWTCTNESQPEDGQGREGGKKSGRTGGRCGGEEEKSSDGMEREKGLSCTSASRSKASKCAERTTWEGTLDGGGCLASSSKVEIVLRDGSQCSTIPVTKRFTRYHWPSPWFAFCKATVRRPSSARSFARFSRSRHPIGRTCRNKTAQRPSAPE